MFPLVRPATSRTSWSVLVFIVCAPLAIGGCGAKEPSAWEPAGSMSVGGEVLDLARRDDQIRVCREDLVGACVAGAIAFDTLEMSGFSDGVVLGILGADHQTIEEFSGTWQRRSVLGDDPEAVAVFVGRSNVEDAASFRLASQRFGTSEGTVDLVDVSP